MARFKYTDDMRKNFSKCMDKNIRVYPIPLAPNVDEYHVEVDRDGKKSLSINKKTKLPIVYNEEEAWKKIFEYYEYFAKN